MAVSFPSIFSSIWNYGRPCFKELEEITIQPEQLQPPPETLEILCRIFSNFALNSKEMVSVSRVCTTWYKASQNLSIPFSQLKKISFLNHYEIEQWKKHIQFRNQQPLEPLEIIRKSRHLKKLDLSKTFIKDKQIDILVSIPFSSLDKIFFHHCPLLERPNFSGIRAREVSIQQCPFLKELTFQGSATQLQKIVVKRCKKIENVRIHNLNSMDEIEIANCVRLKKVHLRTLPNLQTLVVKKCNHLTTFILKKTPSIKEIKISHCPKLAPFNLSEVHALGSLLLKNCEIINSHFTELTSQKLRDVFQLHNLDSLEGIYLKSPILKNINIDGMNGLTALLIDKSPSLVNIVFEGPSPLKYIFLIRCNNLKTLNLKRLSSLQELYLNDCKKLWDVHLQGLDSIQKISMKNCDPYTALQAVFQAKSIQVLFHSMRDFLGCRT